MQTILAIDTETTGLAKNIDGDIEDSANWPHIVQLGWVLAREDGRVLRSRCSLIRPDGWTCSPGAFAVHGISAIDCREHGLPIDAELRELDLAARNADVVIAHYIAFDFGVIACEALRGGSHTRLAIRERRCTKAIGADYMRRTDGPVGHRGPRLGDLYEHLFGRRFEDAHDAMADAMACLRCYVEMMSDPVRSK